MDSSPRYVLRRDLPDASYGLLIPGIVATGISIAAGKPGSCAEDLQTFTRQNASSLRDIANQPVLGERETSEIYGALTSLNIANDYHPGTNIDNPGYTHQWFPEGWLAPRTAKLRQTLSEQPYNESELRTELRDLSGELDTVADSIRTSYSPKVSMISEAILCAGILAVYAIRALSRPTVREALSQMRQKD